MKNLRDLSREQLMEMHCQVFKKWLVVIKKVESLQKEDVISYRQSVANDFDIKKTMLLEKKYHEILKKIDNELQLRIWEGKVD